MSGSCVSLLLMILVISAVSIFILRKFMKLSWAASIGLPMVAFIVLIGPSFIAIDRYFSVVVAIVGCVCVPILIKKLYVYLTSEAGLKVSVAERETTLRMVDEGKISADEAKELLEAMGRSNASICQNKFSRIDMSMLIGVTLVILGFFLPWGYVRMGSVTGWQAGHQVGAIGWAIFIIGILSILPVFFTPKELLYKSSILQIFLLLIGTGLVARMLITVGKGIGAGLYVCLTGFLLTLIASSIKLKRLGV
jgi:hypothetical protein